MNNLYTQLKQFFTGKSTAPTVAPVTVRTIKIDLDSKSFADQIAAIQQARDEAVRDIVAISAEIVARARETERKFEPAPLPTTIETIDGIPTIKPVSKFKKTRTPKAPK